LAARRGSISRCAGACEILRERHEATADSRDIMAVPETDLPGRSWPAPIAKVCFFAELTILHTRSGAAMGMKKWIEEHSTNLQE
jgi:hypothetical protein